MNMGQQGYRSHGRQANLGIFLRHGRPPSKRGCKMAPRVVGLIGPIGPMKS
jgi:hypothetical protein